MAVPTTSNVPPIAPTPPEPIDPCAIKRWLDYRITMLLSEDGGQVMQIETPNGVKTAWHSMNVATLRDVRAYYATLCPDVAVSTDPETLLATATRGSIRPTCF